MKMATALMMLALLGACGSAAEPPTTRKATKVTTIRNDFHDRISALDDLQRGAVLRNAIRTSGESCDRVEASAFQQDYENLKMWTAKCQTSTYAVFLAATGDVQVRPCSQTVELKLPACREPAGAEPRTPLKR